MTHVFMWTSGPEASLPAPGVENRLYIANDTGRWFLDNGTTWNIASLAVQGAWSNTFAYKKNDLVKSASGSWWLALVNNIGVTPVEGATWTLFASKGDQGAQGIQGIQGVQGDQGIQGIQGVAGADGRTIYNGSGAPSAGLGANGDFYIDNTAHTIYGPKTAGAWGSATSLIGPTGPAGGVNSFNGRTGAVVPATGDYSYSQISGTPASLVNTFNGRSGAVAPASGDYSYSQISGTPAIASQAQADAGTDDATIMTPLKVASGTQRGKLTESDLYGDFWVSGSAPSSGVSRTGATVPSQTVYVGGNRFVVPSATNTFAASTTTYVDATTAGAFSFNTNASPTGGALRLYSVVTDATNITAVNDLRQPPTAAKGRHPTGLFRASVNAVQSITSATLSPVKFHVEEVDLDGWFVPGTGATQSRFTPLKRGWYKFGGMVTYQDGTDQQHMRVYAYKNGAVFKALAWTPESGASFIGGGSVTEIWCDGVSDYLEIYTYHTFTGAHNVYSDPSLTWVSGYYLGDTLTATA